MAGHTDNAIVIDAPFDLVWELTNNVTLWPELFTEYASVQILAETETAVRFRLTMHPDENNRAWSWLSEREPDKQTSTVRARRIETGVFKYMNLFWEYQQTPDGVRLRWVQDFELKPDAFTDDTGMANHLNQTARLQQSHLKECVEKAAAERGR